MLNGQKTTRYEICVGFSDKDTKAQKFSEEIYEKIIVNACRGYRVSYSISKTSGGYIGRDGTYVRENSATVVLIGASDDQAEEIAKDLCAFFNQESVLITKSNAEQISISESVKK